MEICLGSGFLLSSISILSFSVGKFLNFQNILYRNTFSQCETDTLYKIRKGIPHGLYQTIFLHTSE